MTHSGGKPHKVGYNGQRYEVCATGYPDNGENVIGWSDSEDGAKRMAAAILKAPSCTSSRVIDLYAIGRKPVTSTQPKMIPNPLWCETCQGRGYLVADAEWEPYAVQCDDCKERRASAPACG